MKPRHDRIPNANSPQLLTRLLEMVSRGVRSSRGLQEALGVDVRTVQYYTQAADWLGFLTSNAEPELTQLGLEYVYAGRDRAAVYSHAVWTTPFVAGLIGTGQKLPDARSIATAILTEQPEMAPSTARRRASSVRSLIAPALKRRPKAPSPVRQLVLPFAATHTKTSLPRTLPTAQEYDPDVYRYVLSMLIDHGELGLAHLRALLDHVGATAAPLSGYVEMAIARGDARRLDERLIVSRAAVLRRSLADTTTSIMLSDPGYRSYLDACMHPKGDRSAEIRRDQVARRYRPWDLRLFGRPLDPARITADLERVLLDRPLSTYPIAAPSNIEVLPVHEPFLDVWDQEQLAICLPPGLLTLRGGVSAINALLRKARQQSGVGLPKITDRPGLFHGGLLHPGEPLPRSVPDTRSLRLRALMHAPYVALTAALLLLHRYRPDRVQIRQYKGKWQVQHEKQQMGCVLDLIDAFADDRGWIAARRLNGGPSFADLAEVLVQIGIAQPVGRRLVLAEHLFVQLRHEAEELEVHAQLHPLAEVLDAWLEWADPSDWDAA